MGTPVTFRILIRCDGTPAERPLMALEQCRAFLPLTPAPAEELVAAANAAGWTVRDRDGAHLCPACTRAILSA